MRRWARGLGAAALVDRDVNDHGPRAHRCEPSPRRASCSHGSVARSASARAPPARHDRTPCAPGSPCSVTPLCDRRLRHSGFPQQNHLDALTKDRCLRPPQGSLQPPYLASVALDHLLAPNQMALANHIDPPGKPPSTCAPRAARHPSIQPAVEMVSNAILLRAAGPYIMALFANSPRCNRASAAEGRPAVIGMTA